MAARLDHTDQVIRAWGRAAAKAAELQPELDALEQKSNRTPEEDARMTEIQTIISNFQTYAQGVYHINMAG